MLFHCSWWIIFLLLLSSSFFFLPLIFNSLAMYRALCVYLLMVHLSSWICTLCFINVGKFSAIISSTIFCPLPQPLLFGTYHCTYIGRLDVVPQISETAIFLHPSFCFSDWKYFPLTCFKVHWFSLLLPQICLSASSEIFISNIELLTPKFAIWFCFIISIYLLWLSVNWLSVIIFSLIF